MVSLIRTKVNFRFLSAIILIGFFAGMGTSIFLHTLDLVTKLRQQHLFLIFFLPLGGFLSTYFYEKFGARSSRGSDLIIEEIHNPKEHIPLRMAPFVLLGTLITHLFGGSAGREGTAVQIGGAFAEKVGQIIKLSGDQRRRLLIVGISAGFGSALGAPWAGMLFGSEVIHGGKIESKTLLESGLASWIAYLVTELFKSPHSHYPTFMSTEGIGHLIVLATFSGILFGLVAFTLSQSMHLIENFMGKLKIPATLKTFFGGVFIVACFFIMKNFKFAGLGLEFIQEAFYSPASISDVIGKMFFTNVTLASGFKGGEFVPLLFIGSHTGSFLGSFFPNDILFLSALGCCAVFAGASNAPFTSMIMACEFFGWSILPFSFVACFMSYLFSGYKGIYKTQKIVFKRDLFKRILNKK